MLGKSLHLGTYAGIPVKVHWTFGLLLLFIAFIGYSEGMDATGILWYVLTILALFCCVVLHEFGHALMARKYNIPTRDIILSPIGGVARLEGLPEKPIREFFIAIAGPLVNVVIAAAIFLILIGLSVPQPFEVLEDLNSLSNPTNWLKSLLYINIALFVFNLVPAFPMDGGRILRSLLAMRLGRIKATKIAADVGRVLAIVFIGIGAFFGQLVLLFIGVFVFFMAGNERKQVLFEQSLRAHTAGQIVRRTYTRLSLNDAIQLPIDRMIQNREYVFLVFNDWNQEIGILDGLKLKPYFSKGEPLLKVADMYTPQLRYITSDATIWDIYQLLIRENLAGVAVKENGQLIGLIDRPLIQNYINLKIKK